MQSPSLSSKEASSSITLDHRLPEGEARPSYSSHEVGFLSVGTMTSVRGGKCETLQSEH